MTGSGQAAHGWPENLPVRQVRVARPTNQLEAVIGFYRDGLGLADDAVRRVASRLEAHGGTEVVAENPYWTNRGAITIEDPDGWRVVLVPQPVF